MDPFEGFPEDVQLTPIPGPFFSELLQQIQHLGELKLTLYAFWRLSHMENPFKYFRRIDCLNDPDFMSGLSPVYEQAVEILEESLALAIERGTLISARLPQGDIYFFINSPKGRAAVEAIQQGLWRAPDSPQAPIEIIKQPVTIYRLYEENIGHLTPLLADALQEAEDTYPAGWIEDAIRIAVKNNKRSWRYVEAILGRWNREGRDAQKEDAKDRRDSDEDHRRYVEGKYSDFIEH